MRRLFLVRAAFASLVACDAATDAGPRVAAIDPVDGSSGQSAMVGTPVQSPPAFLVRDAKGNPVTGVEVAFTVTAGGGAVSPSSRKTDGAGLARVGAWILGERPGENSMAATSAGLTRTVTAEARPGPVSQLTKVGDAQAAVVNTAVPATIGVVLRDRYGNVVPNVAVTFTVLSGGGRLDSPATTSDTAGFATPGRWVLGTTAGVNTARAQVDGALPVDFTATGRVGAAAILAKTGDRQSTTVGTIVPRAIEVTATDAHNNAVPNVSVVFEVVAGGGSLTGGTSATDSLGKARLGSWRLGTVAGANQLRVTVGTVSAAYTAIATPDLPAALTAVAGNMQTDTVDAVLPVRPAVRVSDRYGNAVAGIDVVFGVLSGGGRVTHFSPSDTLGHASAEWTLGASAGTNMLTALLPGVGQPVTFVATAEWPTFAASAVSVGPTHTCALNSAGRAYCWGSNSNGQLGDGTLFDRYLPTPVAATEVFKSIAAGSSWTCAVSLGGTGYCWGHNTDGQLGDGTWLDRSVPGPVDGNQFLTSLSTGELHTCALGVTGDAYCWGWGALGQLGNGQFRSFVPVTPSGGVKFKAVAAGAVHSCGVAQSGAAYCWGEGSVGRLGTGDTSDRLAPALVTGGHTFESLGAGDAHTCGLVTGGQLFCWGDNSVGMLGNGTIAGSLHPIAAAGTLRFESLAARAENTCAITFQGGLYCWGGNSACQLAVGVCSHAPNSTPIAIALEPRAAAPVASVHIGSNGVCAVAAATRNLYCWGLNVGIGDSTNAVVYTPTRVRKR
jgi:alpha-tubulin suppressor-like RCC1 family protein